MTTIADDNTVYKRLVTTAAASIPSAVAGGENLFIDSADNLVKKKNSAGAVVTVGAGASAAGDVVGPASAVDNQFALFDSTTGKLIKAGGLYAQSTYSPTLYNTENISASTAYVCSYYRVGNIVTVFGWVGIDPTSAALGTTLGLSLPIASNFTAIENLNGVGSNFYKESCRIYADTTNDRATMNWTATEVANNTWSFIFAYRVI